MSRETIIVTIISATTILVMVVKNNALQKRLENQERVSREEFNKFVSIVENLRETNAKLWKAKKSILTGEERES